MAPVPRARLCHDDDPARTPAAGPRQRNISPRRAASSSRDAAAMPAAASTASPSARAREERLPSLSARAALPSSASIALPRLLRSFAYFQRMTSARGSEANVDDENAPAMARAVSSTPLGA